MHRLTMRLSPTALLLALLPVVSACSAPETEPAPAPTNVMAFEGGRVLVGDGGVIENATILVDGDRLLAVGPGDTVEVPAGAARVDLTGRTVMPAIIDTHVHLRETRDELVEDLQRKAYYGVGAVLSLGRGSSDMAFQVRDEVIPNAARYRTVGRGITAPEPGRTEIPFWITTEEEARTAVQQLAPKSVDMVKIWVDDRNGQFDKLTPELYGPVIDEAHQQGLRVTAHVYTLEDAKGLLRAGLDAFAHGIRDMDVDDEVVALFAERPDVVLVPNLPGTGVATDLSWLSGTIPPDQLEQMQERSVDRPAAQEAFGIQARNLARLSAEGCDHRLRHRRRRGVEPPCRDGGHGLGGYDGRRPSSWRQPATRPSCSHSTTWGRWKPGRAPTSSSSRRTRWTTSPTPAASSTCISAVRPSTEPP